MHRNSHQKRAPRFSQIRAANYDLQRNRFLGINVFSCIEIVLKLHGPQVRSNSCDRLCFPTKSSAGHQSAEVHRNSPQKRTQWIEKPPGYNQIRATNYDLRRNHLLGVSVSPYTGIVLQNVFRWQKNPLGTLRFN